MVLAPVLLFTYVMYASTSYLCLDVNRPAGYKPPPRWRWLVVPVCFCVVLSTLVWNWPFHIRFAASRAALENEARKLLAAPPAIPPGAWGIPCNRRIGLYWVRTVTITSADVGVRFFTDSGMIDPIGFAYSPAGSAPDEIDVGLPAPWYVYED